MNHGSAWELIPRPKDFDPAKKIGNGSYYHLGHEFGPEIRIYFEGASSTAEYKVDLGTHAMSFAADCRPCESTERVHDE